MDGVGRFPRWLLTGASSPAPRSALFAVYRFVVNSYSAVRESIILHNAPVGRHALLTRSNATIPDGIRGIPNSTPDGFRCTADRAQESETFQTLARDVAPRAGKAGFGSNRRVRSFSRTPAPGALRSPLASASDDRNPPLNETARAVGVAGDGWVI